MSSPKPGTVVVIVGAIVLAVVIALIANGVLSGRASTGVPQATPGPASYWGKPFDVGFDAVRVVDIGVDDMLFMAPSWRRQNIVRGVNLATKQVVWEHTGDGFYNFGGDSTHLVLPTARELTIVDPRTGEVTARVALDVDSELYWAGNGYMLLVEAGDTICVREMRDPGSCVWTARNTSIRDRFGDAWGRVHVFGDGRWVNTGDGVRELATGQAAGFGGDGRGGEYEKEIYYTGSGSRVFRVQGMKFGSSRSLTLKLFMFQPWDTSTDQAVSDGIAASSIIVDEASGVYLAFNADPKERKRQTLSGVEWETGYRRWTMEIDSEFRTSATFIDNKWVVGMNKSVRAVDAVTGLRAWQGGSDLDLAGKVGGLIVTVDRRNLEAFDVVNEFSSVVSLALPKTGLLNPVTVYMTPDYTFCLSRKGQLWILEG